MEFDSAEEPTQEMPALQLDALSAAPRLIAGRYRTLDEIGRGGFGVVWRAIDQRLERLTALKRLDHQVTSDSSSKDEIVREGITREARLLAKLDHPNIVPIWDVDLDDGHPFLVMKLIRGVNLDDLDDRLDQRSALDLTLQAAKALEHAHARGILHRDVKPSNLLIETDSAAKRRIYLADFGLADSLYHPATTGPVGTPLFMDAAAAAGNPTEASDLYALGAVLFELITGERWYRVRSLDVPESILAPDVRVLLERLLASNAPSAEWLVKRLTALLDDSPATGSSIADLSPEPLSDDVERVGRLLCTPAAAEKALEPLSHFVTRAAQRLEGLRRACEERPEERPQWRAWALSLMHLARSTEQHLDPAARKDLGETSQLPLEGTLAALRGRVLAPGAQLLRMLEEKRDAAPRDDFFAFDPQPTATPSEDDDWIDDLASDDELKRYEAVLSLVGDGQGAFLRALRERKTAARNRLLRALWKKADAVLLEGRGRSRPIFEVACSSTSDPEMCRLWQFLFGLFRRDGENGYWQPEPVRQSLLHHSEEDRRILARALLAHPWKPLRNLALEFLEPDDYWGFLAHERVPLEAVLEIWQHLVERVDRRYLKILFVCVKDHLERPGDADRAITAVEMVKQLFQIDGFHENLYFRMLMEVDTKVREEARHHGLLVDFDVEYAQRMKIFTASGTSADQPINGWRGVPLPVQRLLARRGYFLQHFACHPLDPIALECLPHILHSEDLCGFLQIYAINARLLTEVSKENRLFREEQARYLLVANPKTSSFVVARYVSYLRSDLLRKLAQSPEVNPYARQLAKRHLDRRG